MKTKQTQSQFQFKQDLNTPELSLVSLAFAFSLEQGIEKESSFPCDYSPSLRVAVEEYGSSSHGDTVGEGSAVGVFNNGDSICSIPHER